MTASSLKVIEKRTTEPHDKMRMHAFTQLGRPFYAGIRVGNEGIKENDSKARIKGE